MFTRLCNLPKQNSFFLFGARGTGKTSLISAEFLDAAPLLWIDLLEPTLLERYERKPESLIEECLTLAAKRGVALKNLTGWIVVDEVQRCPSLLDIVHKLIESSKLFFALTGSSARKLKLLGANMLAGRAYDRNLYPLTHRELGNQFSLDFVLQWGSLPKLFGIDDEQGQYDYLSTYANRYLNEEVFAEQLVRKAPLFRHFMELAAQANGTVINYSNFAKDLKIDSKTVATYFSILIDTWIGFFLIPYHKSLRKRQVQHPKYYMFDLGVTRSISRHLRVPLLPKTSAYGKAFENFIILECIRLNHYLQKDYALSYLLTKDDAEIDLIIERPSKPTLFIEIKSSDFPDETDVKNLIALSSLEKDISSICICQTPHEYQIGCVRVMNWKDALTEFF